MKQLFIFFFLTVFAFVGNLICQEDNDLSVYFDDGGFTSSKNLVSVNLASILVDDVHFTYERKISDEFSLEIGAGYLMPYYVREINYWIFGDRVFDTPPDGGYSYNIGVNYFYMSFPDDFYNSINFRQRNYTVGVSNVVFRDISYSLGARYNIKGNLMFDYSFGLGYRFESKDGVSGNYKIESFIFPIAIKFDYVF